MKKNAHKLILSKFSQTEVTNQSSKDSLKVILNHNTEYYIRPIKQMMFNYDLKIGTTQIESPISFNLFPLVVDSEGTPWAEANIYILDKINNSLKINILTFSNIASDLACFRQFLDDSNIDFLKFDRNKLYRPTYRYRAYLSNLIESKLLSISSAKRRMSTVIAFYKYLQNEKVLNPDYPPWVDKEYFIDFKNIYGKSYFKKIQSTDISIKQPNSNPIFTDTIIDGGKLKPLSKDEQHLLIKALHELGNIEMFLIHLVALATGARLQTILTFRLHHFKRNMESMTLDEIKIPAGYGTDIDTKNDKRIVLHIPIWLYQKLHIYSLSANSKKRRAKSILGNSDSQYLFLSNRGVPYYQSQKEVNEYNDNFSLHHIKNGQTVRQFIKDKVIPLVKEESENFSYRFHDLRATYGMNLTEEQLISLNKGEKTLNDVREFVRIRMCHESSATTDLYLRYRENLNYVRKISNNYSNYLTSLFDDFPMSFD
ncbi:integrase [Leucothrix sargassi]|nr:integrase [Leucothrix sargassi]